MKTLILVIALTLTGCQDWNIQPAQPDYQQQYNWHRTQQQIMNHGAGGCTPNFSTGGCL